MKIPTENEIALNAIELDICSTDEIETITDAQLEDFYTWAESNWADYNDVDGIDGVQMLLEFIAKLEAAAQNAADERGDHLYHLSIGA